MIKEKIKYNGNDMNLKISLSSEDNFIDYQQEIDNLTQFTSIDLVNPVSDGEIRRFKVKPNTNTLISTINFWFYYSTLGNYSRDYTNVGFTNDEISYNKNNFLKSFFILDYYDTYDINSQTKIFTTYITKKSSSPTFPLSANTQQYYQNIPLSYINSQTGTTTTGYTKFSFYNAKNGIVTLFYNNDNVGMTTQEKYYFKTELDLSNQTWKIMTQSYLAITATEIINNQYINRVNATYIKFDDLKQTYPSGNTYNYNNNNYLIT